MGDQSEPPLLLDEKYVSIEEENVNACIGTEDGDIKLVPSLMGSLKLHGQTNEESTPAGAAAISDRCSDVIDVLDGTTDPQGACVDDVGEYFSQLFIDLYFHFYQLFLSHSFKESYTAGYLCINIFYCVVDFLIMHFITQAI